MGRHLLWVLATGAVLAVDDAVTTTLKDQQIAAMLRELRLQMAKTQTKKVREAVMTEHYMATL
eukprot:4241151-Prymnesium_polylepis.2